MVNFCAVIGCSNRGGTANSKSFYRIPAVIYHQGDKTRELSKKRHQDWLRSISRGDLNTDCLNQYRICSDHFINGGPSNLYDITNPDWVPSQKMGNAREIESPDKSVGRYQRSLERSRKKVKTDLDFSTLELPEDSESTICTLKPEENSECVAISIQTDVTSFYINNLECEIARLRSENADLKTEIQGFKFSQDSFLCNDEKVKYFTGLPNYLVLMTLFNFLQGDLVQNDRNVLNKFQQLMLTLMRLRLNLPLTLLGYLFKVSSSTVSKTYCLVINVMHIKLKRLVYWPQREELRKTMPMCFRKHFKSNVAVIVDCFEIFIERPSNLKARAMTWSSYKHNNTVKYLIGITPQGVISFISSGWGGRASDKHITEHCDLLQKLLPGDIVLADRGFDIADSVGSVAAELKIPAFTKNKNQLSPLDIEQTRKIANVRIHVERVIGNLRQKYTFISGVIPVDHLICPSGDIPMLDKEIVIACALINMNESVIPFD